MGIQFVAWGISSVDYLTIWGYGVKLHRKYISLKRSEFSGGFSFLDTNLI